VRSIFAQTLCDWELILIDDGSGDGSLRIARGIDDRRVRVVADGRNLRLAARLNQLARLARAPLLARMDADDLMHPDRLRLQVAAMEADPKIEVTGSSAVVVDSADRPLGVRGTRLPSSAAEVLRSGLFVHPTVMFRTRWARAHPYSTGYPRAEDFELWARTARDASMLLLPQALLFYRDGAPLRIAAYAATQRSRRAVLRRYGPRLMGTRETARLVAKTLLSEAALRVASAFGRDEVLLARRNQPLSAQGRAAALVALALIRAERVPGVDFANSAASQGT